MAFTRHPSHVRCVSRVVGQCFYPVRKCRRVKRSLATRLVAVVSQAKPSSVTQRTQRHHYTETSSSLCDTIQRLWTSTTMTSLTERHQLGEALILPPLLMSEKNSLALSLQFPRIPTSPPFWVKGPCNICKSHKYTSSPIVFIAVQARYFLIFRRDWKIEYVCGS